jgi:hypothetical protein
LRGDDGAENARDNHSLANGQWQID